MRLELRMDVVLASCISCMLRRCPDKWWQNCPIRLRFVPRSVFVEALDVGRVTLSKTIMSASIAALLITNIGSPRNKTHKPVTNENKMNGLSDMVSDRRNRHSSLSDWRAASIDVVQVGTVGSLCCSSSVGVEAFLR
jgi:hypothetical protein